MTQRELEKAIARATGEPVEIIRRIGFRLVGEPAVESRKRENVIPWQNSLLRKEDE